MDARTIRKYKIVKTVLMNLAPVSLVSCANYKIMYTRRLNILMGPVSVFADQAACTDVAVLTAVFDVSLMFYLLDVAVQGLYLEIAGPTLPDLKHALGVNYEEIARTLVARSVGYFLSSALAGVAADLFPR